MSKISCKLFGVPQIMKDGQSVFLPYAKINALLYYMLINKVVSRTEIAGLLWPDSKKEPAQRGLSDQALSGTGYYSLPQEVCSDPQSGPGD